MLILARMRVHGEHNMNPYPDHTLIRPSTIAAGLSMSTTVSNAVVL
jgi:hypothetical protein